MPSLEQQLIYRGKIIPITTLKNKDEIFNKIVVVANERIENHQSIEFSQLGYTMYQHNIRLKNLYIIDIG